MAAAFEPHEAAERKTLVAVLAINIGQSIAGGVIGWWAVSTGLMGAALDNLADAGVYGVALYAVGRTAEHKARAARLSGWLLIGLAVLLLAEVLRRFVTGAEPVGVATMIAAAVNASLNVVCLRLLSRHRKHGAHFKASWIFTGNDTLMNLGIVFSGLLVMLLNSPAPDLVIGLIVAAMVIHGGTDILRVARKPA